MSIKKEKTTILFVNKHQQVSRPLLVPNSLVVNWKKYLLGLSLFILSLIITIVYLGLHTHPSSVIAQQVVNTSKQPIQQNPEMDTALVRQRFTKIDQDLVTINSFLKARGIPSAFKEPQGGEGGNDIVSTEEITGFYEGYLNKIMNNIAYTPLGLPYNGAITSTFGHRENPFGGNAVETHKGLDIKGPIGGKVKAMAKGVVQFAGTKGGFGNCIILRHANGFETLYGHLSRILVREGQQIDIGDEIGDIGSTGRSTGPHLHYEIHRYGQKINPQSFLTL